MPKGNLSSSPEDMGNITEAATNDTMKNNNLTITQIFQNAKKFCNAMRKNNGSDHFDSTSFNESLLNKNSFEVESLNSDNLFTSSLNTMTNHLKSIEHFLILLFCSLQ